MGKNRLVSLVLFSLVLATGFNVYAQQPGWQDIGAGNMHFSIAWVNPDDRFVILAGSENTVLKTEDGGKNWRRVLSVRGQAGQVKFIAAGGNSRFLFAATNNGLYLSRDQGNNWKRVFKGKNYLEDECTTVAVLNDRVYLGTKAGLFLSKDKCRSWHKETGSLADSQICAIAVETGNVYVASAQGIFKANQGAGGWDKIFIANYAEDEGEPEEEPEEENEGNNRQARGIYYLVSDCRKPGYLYLASGRGIYKSVDSGKSWELLADYGLLDKYVNFLSVSPDSLLYAATKKGIFAWRQGRWYEVSIGLTAQDIKALSFDKQGDLYAACDSGLFKGYANYYSESNGNKTDSLSFSSEPEIREVQEAAIKYAEVDPDKITEWRKKAKMKAILPKLTVGIDNSSNSNYEIYTSATTRYVYEGPEDKSSGWDVTLSWDLGELIWNADQTNIDVRSRLMVELRDDILDEVTKIYFERIRVKGELDNLAIEDKRKRLEKELRLAELTATLDGLTGGYFSRSLKKPKAQCL